MQIVTLTTDLGLRDHYIASLKGQLLSKFSDIHLVDISHDVVPFSISEASYYINNVITDFPEGTIHFIGVDSIPEISIDSHATNSYPIVMKLNGQYFVGSDNGIFSLLNNYKSAESIIRLDFSSTNVFRHPFKNIYVPAILAILKGESLSRLGEEIAVSDLNVALVTQALIGENLLKGSVIHVDNYENIIININEQLFRKIGQGNPFTIYLKEKQYFINVISANYNEVPTGEKIAFFNENDWLEIALNKATKYTGGGASSLMGIKLTDVITIEFHPKGSKDKILDLFG